MPRACQRKAGYERLLRSRDSGAGPSGILIEDEKRNLYGTTIYGGGGPCKVEQAVVGCGTVFKLSPPKEKGGAWTETVLHGFQGTDGSWPVGGVARDAVGNLYGTTETGGAGNCGCGTVFKLDRAHEVAVLHSFNGSNGYLPMGGLVLDAAGNLYGVTYEGGNLQDCGGGGCGTVFKVSSAGKGKVLYSFTGMNGDGQQPSDVTLVRDSAGNLYGTTVYGGTPVNGLTFGTVFKVSAKGKETVLYSFQGFLDGGYPFMGLLRDAEGNLYGIADRFGKFQYGTFFEVKRTGKFAVLHSFNQLDGYSTGSPLFMDATRNLYGVLSDGGNYQDFCEGYGCGTVFKFTP